MFPFQLSTKSSTTDFPETMSQKTNPVLPPAECNFQLFNFWKELNQAIEKNLQEDTTAGDKPTTSSASHSASAANSAAALLRQLDPVNPHANCIQVINDEILIYVTVVFFFSNFLFLSTHELGA